MKRIMLFCLVLIALVPSCGSSAEPTVVSPARVAATAQALVEQATAHGIETENAGIIAEWTATGRASLFTATPEPTRTETADAVLGLLPAPTDLPTEAPATDTPKPTGTNTPEPTPTIFYVVVTSVPTNTPKPVQTTVPTRVPATETSIPEIPTAPPQVQPTAPPINPPASGQVVISFIFFDGVVPRAESDEYAEITNTGGSSTDISGWRLNAGNPGQDFHFPSGLVLQPGQACRVYTNQIHPEFCALSYGRGAAVWNNGGDCGHLYNAAGGEVSQKCY